MIVDVQPSGSCADLGLRDGRDLVDHYPAGRVKSVPLVRLHDEPKQWSVGLVGREGADGNRVRRAEGVVLHDDDWPRLTCIVLPAGDRPDVASLHSSPRSETASMNAWSSNAWALPATAADWRWASLRKAAERTSGAQIWTGRRPCFRSRLRCSRTLTRDGLGLDADDMTASPLVTCNLPRQESLARSFPPNTLCRKAPCHRGSD